MSVTLSDFEYMKEATITDIIGFLMSEKGFLLSDAMNFVYNSETFAQLENPETDLFTQSSRYVYNRLLNELEQASQGNI